MKKIIALLLALVMVLSLGTVAFAQDSWRYEPTAAEIVGEFAANAAARALQIPAFVLGSTMELNRIAVVNAVNVGVPMAYYGAEVAANVLDNAVALGAYIAQARITVAGGSVALAAEGVSKLLGNIKDNSNLVELSEEADAAAEAIWDMVEAADKAIQKVSVGVDKVTDLVFDGTLGQMKAAIAAVRSHNKTQSGFETSLNRPEEAKRAGFIDIGRMTIEEIVTPGAWQKYVVTGLGRTQNSMSGSLDPNTLDSDLSYLAGLVDNFIDEAASALKTNTHFTEMNGAWWHHYNDSTNAGGEVAEALYAIGFGLINGRPWDGYVPSLESTLVPQSSQGK